MDVIATWSRGLCVATVVAACSTDAVGDGPPAPRGDASVGKGASSGGAPAPAAPITDAGADARSGDLACPKTGSGATFAQSTIDDDVPGAAFVRIADVDGDGSPDVLVSAFGKLAGPTIPAGELRLYTRGVGGWSATSILSPAEGVKFPNAPTVVDIDDDGDLDVIVPHGFLACTAIPGGGPCGGLFWLEKTPPGYVRHPIVGPSNALFFHAALVVDVDGDGTRDLVTVGEAKGGMFGGQGRAETLVFEGDASLPSRFAATPTKLADGLGSFPSFADVDGDGDQDLVSAEYFLPGGGFAWLERAGSSYTRHVIDTTDGPGMMLKLVPNLYGDGRTLGIATNHTNTKKSPPDAQAEGVFVLEPGADVRKPWKATRISDGIVSRPGSPFAPQAAPGPFAVGDLDGDGDLDVAVSGDGDDHVFWLEQTRKGCWLTHTLMTGVGQAGALAIADIDEDGKLDIVVPVYEKNALYVLSRK